MELFEKGNMGTVRKQGAYISKTRPFNIFTIKRFLKYLEEKSDFTPYYIRHDTKEITLSYVKGETIHTELSQISYEHKIEMIKSSAKLLKKFHHLSEQFERLEEDLFYLNYEGFLEKDVICHNDFAPYNITFNDYKAVGIIDFDTICPAPREWDLAYAMYRFILIDPTLEPSYDELIELFLKYYNYEKVTNFYPIVIERIQSLVNLFDTEIEKGNLAFIKMEKEGHKDFYLREIDRISNLNT